VLLDSPIEEGSEIVLVLVLTQEGVEDPDHEPLETRATVTWCAPTDDGRAMMGLRFSPIEQDVRTRLGGFLNALSV